VKNPIDAFVLARLETEGLKPSPEADRTTLIRRVTLDLTGLPPTIEEVDAFLNDKSPNAYEKVVDRLLASPHYGEKMALPWLDAARYADSNGFQQDGDTFQYVWRDWVVQAMNANLTSSRSNNSPATCSPASRRRRTKAATRSSPLRSTATTCSTARAVRSLKNSAT
jgi:hypothetical protein